MAKVMSKYPPGAASQYMFPGLLELYPHLADQGALYVDVWPIFPPMIVVFDPDMISQFTQDQSLPKHELLREQFKPFTQNFDVVSQNGQEWKTWRSIFNPGFSAKNLSAIMPLLLEEIDAFRDWLKTTARSGKAVPLESQAIKLTVDLIGRASMWVGP
jgi:cytochrome P450